MKLSIATAEAIDQWERSFSPTPAEIAERAAEIRQGWTEWEHGRRAGVNREPLEFQPTALCWESGEVYR